MMDSRQVIGLNPGLCGMEKAILEQAAAGGGSFLDGIAIARWRFTRAAATGGTTEMSHVVLLTRTMRLRGLDRGSIRDFTSIRASDRRKVSDQGSIEAS